MTPDQFERVKSIFLEAAEKPAGEQDAFIQSECNGDEEVASEVHALLQHHRPDRTLLTPPPDWRSRWLDEAGARAPKSKRQQNKASGKLSAGRMIGGRYRIVSRLGEGGMGQVYRADDLKLGQTVALKFLPAKLAGSARWRQRLHTEVRIAREVTHPNVCRVYDIGEAHGQPFISMELIDGEDLASLLRRIDRLPQDKAAQLARQLCAGLGAAHDRGVLHRDLKPANIMIDGRGSLRITDFGIAALADEAEEDRLRAGTPGYMAPEQLAGKPADIRSDIYALGLILYEMVTGKRALPDEIHQPKARSKTSPLPPSRVTNDIDPAFEQVILQCLDAEPSLRPSSVYEVLAALPGSTSLEAALAAGETPSPEMVAALGKREGMRPRYALGLAAATILGLLAILLCADAVFVVPRAGIDLAMPVLHSRAEQVLERFGYPPDAADWAHQLVSDTDRVRDWAERKNVRWTDEMLANGQPPVVYYWYRQSPQLLVPLNRAADLSLSDPPNDTPGMRAVRLDPKGRLIEFLAVPARIAGPRTARPETAQSPAAIAVDDIAPNWSDAFALAGLDMARFSESPVIETPPVFATERRAWVGAYPSNPSLTVRVVGAAFEGRVVHFAVIEPWNDELGGDGTLRRSRRETKQSLDVVLMIVVLLGGLLLARRNTQLGRIDRRGAWKLGTVVLVLGMLAWVLGSHHVANLTDEFRIFMMVLAINIFRALLAALFYIAVEPFVRRIWPASLVSWSRLSTGNWKHPVVGRAILAGMLLGVAAILLCMLDAALPIWLGPPGSGADLRFAMGSQSLAILDGVAQTASVFFMIPIVAIWLGLFYMLMMLLFRVVLRNTWLAAFAFVLPSTAATTIGLGTHPILSALIYGLVFTAISVVMVKVGLLAVMVGIFTFFLISTFPITADFTAWYGEATIFAVIVLVGLLGFGVHQALGGRPLWDLLAID